MDYMPNFPSFSSICIEPVERQEYNQDLCEILSAEHKRVFLLFIQAERNFLRCNF